MRVSPAFTVSFEPIYTLISVLNGSHGRHLYTFVNMTSKSSKQSRKETKTDLADGDSGELNMAGIAKLLDEHRQALLSELKSSISSLEAKIDCVQSAVSDHSYKIASLESSANALDERVLALEATCTALSDSNAKLLAKVSDLESRSRRNNIRIVGLPESIEGPRPSAYFSQLLFDVMGEDVLPSPPEIDRAHRTLVNKPAAGEKPRAVIIRIHRYQQKERIIREARVKRGKLMFQGNPIAIYEDYAPEVMAQRSKYRRVMADLYNLGLKPALLFPARLSIKTKDGGKRSFSSVTEAEDYVASARADSSL